MRGQSLPGADVKHRCPVDGQWRAFSFGCVSDLWRKIDQT